MIYLLVHKLSVLSLVNLYVLCVIGSLWLSQVYVIGEEGILEELELAGFTGLGGPVIYSFLFQTEVCKLVDKI